MLNRSNLVPLKATVRFSAISFFRATLFIAAPLAAAPVAQAAQADAAEPGPEADVNADAVADVDPTSTDNLADNLNASQQLKQSFTFTRTINGAVVEREEREVVYDRTDPVRPTEAGLSTMESLRAAFDEDALTRTEAYEEATLDFTLADQDRDGAMSADEYMRLVAVWRQNQTPSTSEEATDAPILGAAMALVDDDEEAEQFAFEPMDAPTAAANARTAQSAASSPALQFSAMAGAESVMSKRDYVREYLVAFDAVDADGDGVLLGEELTRFRAAVRGAAL